MRRRSCCSPPLASSSFRLRNCLQHRLSNKRPPRSMGQLILVHRYKERASRRIEKTLPVVNQIITPSSHHQSRKEAYSRERNPRATRNASSPSSKSHNRYHSINVTSEKDRSQCALRFS